MTFNTGSFTMERIEMTSKIRALKNEYGISDIEFVGLINGIHEELKTIPNTAWVCEDVLFEIFARCLKGKELSNWIAEKMTSDFLKTNSNESTYEIIVDAIKSNTADDAINVFRMYSSVNSSLNVIESPPFSAISALKEMYEDSIRSEKSTPPGGEE